MILDVMQKGGRVEASDDSAGVRLLCTYLGMLVEVVTRTMVRTGMEKLPPRRMAEALLKKGNLRSLQLMQEPRVLDS